METTLNKSRRLELGDSLGELQGTLARRTSRADMIRALGEPHEGETEKTGATWWFDTPAGWALIYDWKQVHLGDDVPLAWDVSGPNRAVVRHVEDFVKARLAARKG